MQRQRYHFRRPATKPRQQQKSRRNQLGPGSVRTSSLSRSNSGHGLLPQRRGGRRPAGLRRRGGAIAGGSRKRRFLRYDTTPPSPYVAKMLQVAAFSAGGDAGGFQALAGPLIVVGDLGRATRADRGACCGWVDYVSS
jgi:hypothetical protein